MHVVDPGFTRVESKRSRRRSKRGGRAARNRNPGTEKAVLVYFETPEPHHASPIIALLALDTANKVLEDSGNPRPAPFLRASFTGERSLVLAAGYGQAVSDYETHLDALELALRPHFGRGRARICEPWSKFLVHQVPTSMTMEEIRASFETTYTNLRMGQTPRWLTAAEKRAGKKSSSVVITLVGNHTLASLGTKELILRNLPCRMEEHLGFGAATQCRNCQRFGHHTRLCQSTAGPICAICAGNHATRTHPCNVPACAKGPACRHAQAKCANCGGPHRSYDPACPHFVSPTAPPRGRTDEAHASTHTDKNRNTFPDTSRVDEMEL